MSDETTLAELIRAQAIRYGAKTALRFGSDTISYAELDRRANRVANGLSKAGIGRGDRIATIACNHPVHFELLFATAKLGAILVPVNWRLADPEIAWILGDARPKAVHVAEPFEDRVAALLCDAPLLLRGSEFAAWREAQNATDPAIGVATDEVAVQLYTSGTTGRPKGAMLTNRNLLVLRSMPPEQQPEWNRFTDDDVSLLVMPSFHIGGTGYGIQTLAAGATGLIAQEFRAGDVLDYIERERLSKIFIVPSALQMLVEHPRARGVDYSRIRTILYGASPIPISLLREAIDVFGCGFVQMYGMTETCGTITALPPEDHCAEGNRRMLSAGAPLKGVELRILGEDGTALTSGEVGEIAVRSELVMKGYWGRPEETAEVLSADGWYRTGDAGYLDADGYLFLKDRVKDMIVTGGENVYPAEVEAVLSEHPAIAEVAVIGVPSAKWGEEVKAVIVLRDDAIIGAAELLAWARERLAGYKLPKSIDFLSGLPRGATGKVLRRELRAPYWAGSERQIA